MNPFAKRNAAEKQKRETARAEEVQQVEDIIKEALAIKDPAERVIQLKWVRDTLGYMIAKQQYNIERTADKKGAKAFLATSMPILGAGAAVFIIAAAPVAFGALAAGMCVGAACGSGVDKIRKRSVKKSLETETSQHILHLADKILNVTRMMDETVTEHVQAIAKSPLHGEIMKDAHLSELFSAAAAKRLVAQEEEVSALKKAQEEKAKAEQSTEKTDVKKQDWQKLADAMKPPEEKAKKPRTRNKKPGAQ